MEGMFGSAFLFKADISKWDVSEVTNMNSMFQASFFFNGDISGWDVSQVTDMASMFSEALFFNQNLCSWDVSKVTDMTRMFIQALSFNQNLCAWDVSNVTDMDYMFYFALSFNQNLCTWGSTVPSSSKKIDMFRISGCPVKDDPSLTDESLGPFCYTCDEVPVCTCVQAAVAPVNAAPVNLCGTPPVAGTPPVTPENAVNLVRDSLFELAPVAALGLNNDGLTALLTPVSDNANFVDNTSPSVVTDTFDKLFAGFIGN